MLKRVGFHCSKAQTINNNKKKTEELRAYFDTVLNFFKFFFKTRYENLFIFVFCFQKKKKLTRSFEKKGFKFFSKLVFALLAHVFEVRSGSRVGK